MINLSHSVSGETIGLELSRDAEEAARALFEMAQHIDPSELIEQLEQVTAYENKQAITRLVALGQAIASATDHKAEK